MRKHHSIMTMSRQKETPHDHSSNPSQAINHDHCRSSPMLGNCLMLRPDQHICLSQRQRQPTEQSPQEQALQSPEQQLHSQGDMMDDGLESEDLDW